MTCNRRAEGVLFRLNDGADQPLFDLLPAAYTGALDAIRAEINELVGLAPVKRCSVWPTTCRCSSRAAAGLKTASLSMHMIFTGNPGTGKTTIARLVARYLKAIGALKGGQLVEVTRADLWPLHRPHRPPDQQRHRERPGRRSSLTRHTAFTAASRTASAGSHRHAGEGDGGSPG